MKSPKKDNSERNDALFQIFLGGICLSTASLLIAAMTISHDRHHPVSLWVVTILATLLFLFVGLCRLESAWFWVKKQIEEAFD